MGFVNWTREVDGEKRIKKKLYENNNNKSNVYYTYNVILLYSLSGRGVGGGRSRGTLLQCTMGVIFTADGRFLDVLIRNLSSR